LHSCGWSCNSWGETPLAGGTRQRSLEEKKPKKQEKENKGQQTHTAQVTVITLPIDTVGLFTGWVLATHTAAVMQQMQRRQTAGVAVDLQDERAVKETAIKLTQQLEQQGLRGKVTFRDEEQSWAVNTQVTVITFPIDTVGLFTGWVLAAHTAGVIQQTAVGRQTKGGKRGMGWETEAGISRRREGGKK
jgi:ribosomal protein L19